jgi:hypothetical protein
MIATDLIQLGGRFGLNLILFLSAALVFGREVVRNHALTPMKRLLWGLAFFVYQLAWSDRRRDLSFGFSIFVVAETAVVVFIGVVLMSIWWPAG